MVASVVVAESFLLSGKTALGLWILLPVAGPYVIVIALSVVAVTLEAEHRPLVPTGSIFAVRFHALIRWVNGAFLLVLGAVVGGLLGSDLGLDHIARGNLRSIAALSVIVVGAAMVLGTLLILCLTSIDMARLGAVGRREAIQKLLRRNPKASEILAEFAADAATPLQSLVAGLCAVFAIVFASQWLLGLLS
ncbi:hypothetical protein GCM10027052_25680 [Parafrigoribacterium mesophilum]